MTKMTFTRWQKLAAIETEGVYLLFWLCLRLAEWLPLLWLLNSGFPAVAPTPAHLTAVAAVAGGWLLQGVCLPPLRLGRLLWYARLADEPQCIPPLTLLFAGWRRWGAIFRWRWLLWWRRTVALCLACLPALTVWQVGAAADTAYQLLWLLGGFLLLGGGLLLLWLRQSRYALAPLLLAEGWGASAALQLSARILKGQGTATLAFWGARVPCLAGCLLPPFALWLIPSLRLENAARLLWHRRHGPLPAHGQLRQDGACFLRPSLL